MKKWIFRIVVSVLILFILIWFGGKFYFSFSTADYSGDISVKGISEDIEIDIDSMGVPQIYAKNDRDLYFGLGWVHASERLFHMELIRRVAEGRLSELFGEKALKLDIFQRKIGFERKAKEEIQSMDNYTKDLLQAYCNGINSWIKYKDVLPPEFFVLGADAEEWTVNDVTTVMLYQTWYAHYLMDHDKEYNEMIEKFGPEMYNILSEFKNWSPATVFNSDDKSASLNPTNYLMSFASNSMVISPNRSASGYALHESDPHLQINTVPGFWYIVGLHSGDGTNIVGITVPSIPFVVMGHNKDIAFAFTVASVDLIDYFRWKVNPEDSTQILTSSGYQKIETINEEIKVKDSEPYNLEIKITPRGPVTEQDSTGLISLWWSGFDFNTADIMKAGFRLQNAKNFEQFRNSVTSFGALDVNWTYSDSKGNIGYQLGSPIPIRNFENTYSILPGEDTSYYAKGYWDLSETPHVYNPKEGFAATCNNQILSEDSGKKIPGFYDPYRIVRAFELLKEKSKYSVEDIKRIQQDLISVKAKRWKSLFAEAAEILGEKELADQIKEWNCEMTLNSQLAAIFSLWWHELPRVIFSDEMGEHYEAGTRILEEVLSHPELSVIDDKVTKSKKETLSDVAAIALEKVLIEFGKPKYGEVNFQTLKHPLSVVKILDFYFNLNRGPFPIGGDNSTLNANIMGFNDENNSFDAIVGPSMRFILDWSDVDKFLMISNLGQSGNPFSPHYDDFLAFMQQGKYWNIPFNRDKILARTKNILKLRKFENN